MTNCRIRGPTRNGPCGSVKPAKKPMTNEPVTFTNNVPSGKISPNRSATSPDAQNRAPVPRAPPSIIQKYVSIKRLRPLPLYPKQQQESSAHAVPPPQAEKANSIAIRALWRVRRVEQPALDAR